MAGWMLNTKGLKNMGIITDVISHPSKIQGSYPQHKDAFGIFSYLLKAISSERCGRISREMSCICYSCSF